MVTSRFRIAPLIVGVATAAIVVAVAGLVATGRLCITSPRRPADRYGEAPAAAMQDDAGHAAGGSADPLGSGDNADGGSADSADHGNDVPPAADDSAVLHGSDADADGIADNEDVLATALAYVQTRPHYKSAYYASGYPDDEFGVCTDVVAIACREAGYDLQALMAADIAVRRDAYAIETPDPAIDFRRTPNLEVFFNERAQRLTTDPSRIAEWRGGDIVLYEGHVGIVSDRRNERGVPYLIHHSGPFQLRYEEDKLEDYGNIVGHYRLDPRCLSLLE